MFKQSILHLSVLVALAVPASVQAQDTDNTEIRAQLELLKARIAELEEKLEQQEQVAQQQQQEDASVDPVERRAQTVSSERIQIADVEQLEERLEDTKNTPIEVGGAVRFQYEYADYNEGNKDRIGDLDFDIFRLDLRGEMGDVILSLNIAGLIIWTWFSMLILAITSPTTGKVKLGWCQFRSELCRTIRTAISLTRRFMPALRTNMMAAFASYTVPMIGILTLVFIKPTNKVG